MTGPLSLGLIGGLTSAMLYVAALSGTPLALFLFYLAPLPILLAGLGWGWTAAALAAAAGAIASAVMGDLRLALFFLASAGLPAAWLSYLGLLARSASASQVRPGTGNEANMEPGQSPAPEWYPVGRLIVWSAVLSCGLALLALWVLGPGEETFRSNTASIFNALLEANPDIASRLGDDTDRREATDAMTMMLLPMTAASWTVSILFNLWLAARLLRASDRLRRPWPNLRATQVPLSVSLFWVGSIGVAIVTGGLISILATVAAASLSIVFLLVGLSVVHAIVPTTASRPLILGAIYAVIVLFLFAGLVVVLIGAAEPFIGLRNRAGSGPAPPFST